MSEGALKKTKLPGKSFDIQSGNTGDSAEPNNCRAIETVVSSADKDVTSLLKATTGAPPHSFEFYVWKDEGINLYVDLNSSVSDWMDRFRNEVCTSENVYRKEPGILCQETGCLGECAAQGKSSFLLKTKTNPGQIYDHNGQFKSSNSLKLGKGDFTGLDLKNKGGSPLICDTLTTCSMTVNVKENQSAELTVNDSTISAEVSYGAPNNISGAESCAKDLSKKILDSDAVDTPFIKSPCGSVGNILSDPDTAECQTWKLDTDEDCAMLNGSSFVNPGASLSGSMELQISEVASCHKYASLSLCENNRFLDLSDKNTLDVEQVGLVNSSEICLDTDGKNLPSPTEGWVLGKIVDGRESSECSQFDDPLKKSGLESDDQESKMKLCQKRRHIYSEVQGSSDKPVTKSLRSLKNVAATVQPRRSMRLISK